MSAITGGTRRVRRRNHERLLDDRRAFLRWLETDEARDWLHKHRLLSRDVVAVETVTTWSGNPPERSDSTYVTYLYDGAALQRTVENDPPVGLV